MQTEGKRLAHKRWRVKNPEKAKESAARNRAKRREKNKEYNKKYRQAHREEKAAYNKKYQENHKEQLPEYTEKDRKKKAEYYQKHKESIRKYAKEYLATPAGREAHRKARHRRRALEMGAYYEDFHPADVFQRDGYKCQYCGKKTRPDFNRHHPLYPNLDHIISLSNGGPHTRVNTQCLCRQCNLIKHNNDSGAQLRLFG